uniref:Uncharacterized protein n=1 Tax=Ananas comosus var. bracteatus TaxID=296719 RepID=A0A6V7PF12_ANACO|nr:unnamed protein product [Ananas comosus var. bracteatus]
MQRSHYTIERVLPDISYGKVSEVLTQVANRIEPILETLPTLPNTVQSVPPRPTKYNRPPTSGHVPLHTPSQPNIVPTPAMADRELRLVIKTQNTQPVVEGATIEHLGKWKVIEPFDEHGVDRGHDCSRRRMDRHGRGRETRRRT